MSAGGVWAIALLAAGAIALLAGRRAVWIGPVIAALVALATRAVPVDVAVDALGVIRDPLLFLVVAVPLAVALDRLGVFEALAGWVDGGRHLVLGLWVLAAGVTIVFNLDDAVVLLTPLYIRIAHRHGLPVEALAFQPALLACLASLPLPVSNLTNLVVAEQLDLGVGSFVTHLGPIAVVTIALGWWRYRAVFGIAEGTAAHPELPVDVGALTRGLPVIVGVLVGFTIGPELGIEPWVVGLVALAATCLADRRAPPWRSVPVEAIAIAAALSLLVAGALPSLHLDRLLDGTGAWGRAQALLVGAAGSDLTNNLPAVLAAGPSLAHPDQAWALLVGTNVAPVAVITGSLSGLLWRDTSRRLGLDVSARRYATIGWRVGGPAFVAAALLAIWGW